MEIDCTFINNFLVHLLITFFPVDRFHLQTTFIYGAGLMRFSSRLLDCAQVQVTRFLLIDFNLTADGAVAPEPTSPDH